MDGARAVVDNWQPRINVDPEWPVLPLQGVCDIQRGKFSTVLGTSRGFTGGIILSSRLATLLGPMAGKFITLRR